jgi:hypothetical protein
MMERPLIVRVIASGPNAAETCRALLRNEPDGIVPVRKGSCFEVTYSDGRIIKWPHFLQHSRND